MYLREELVIYQFPRRKFNLFDLPVSAGTGQFLDSDRFSEIEVGDEVAANADFGVRVAGDSMEPLYLDGQIIWIHKQDTLEEGEIGIFFLDGEAYVKKYHQTDSGIQLISLNSKLQIFAYQRFLKIHSENIWQSCGLNIQKRLVHK